MTESELERYFVYRAYDCGARTFKFRSPAQRGVADRIVCLPDGSTWFVELKVQRGRLSPLQEVFADTMRQLKQNYICLWSIKQVDKWYSDHIKS